MKRAGADLGIAREALDEQMADLGMECAFQGLAVHTQPAADPAADGDIGHSPRPAPRAQSRLRDGGGVDVGVHDERGVQPLRQGLRQIEPGPARLGRRQHQAAVLRGRIDDQGAKTGHAQPRDRPVARRGDQGLDRRLGRASRKPSLIQHRAGRILDPPHDLGPAGFDGEEDGLGHGEAPPKGEMVRPLGLEPRTL